MYAARNKNRQSYLQLSAGLPMPEIYYSEAINDTHEISTIITPCAAGENMRFSISEARPSFYLRIGA